MAQEIADSTLLDTWASSGLIIEPDISKIIEGWQLGEQPPHEYMNWLQNTFGSKLNHILKNGVAKWNNTTQYLAGSSVQHSGNVWLCKVDNTNSEPTDANANWKRIITVESLTTVLNGYVDLTGNQTIGGVKTFSSNPISSATQSTAANALTRKDYVDGLDSANVKKTGDQTIAGVKTFSSSPIVPTPKTDFQATTARSTSITVNVGAGQTYTTINQALEYLSGFYPLHKTTGVTATINLKAGFVMNEQVLVRGLNLGWITIVGEDAETIITHTALTTAFNGGYPAFGVDKGGTSPVIGQLFRFNVEKVGENKHGLMATGAGSSANINTGAGFIGAGTNGIYAANNSTVNADGANASNAGTYGIYAANNSTINANNTNASNAGACGIIANGVGIIGAYGAIIQNQTTGTSRVKVQDGSHIEASGINTTGGTVPALSQAANTLTGQGIIYQ